MRKKLAKEDIEIAKKAERNSKLISSVVFGSEEYHSSPGNNGEEDIPILNFEGQLKKVNAILHRWLDDCLNATFSSPEKKFSSIATMTKALHENIKLVGETLKMLLDIHDQRVFQRIILEAIRDVDPETRLKIIKKLQLVRANTSLLPKLPEPTGNRDILPINEGLVNG